MDIQYFDDGDLACFNGLSFRRDKRTGYYLNAKTHKRLHVAVWEYHCGPVPEGCEIHHEDFDKSNNEFWNLQCLSMAEHRKLHGKSLTEDRKAAMRKNLEENARPAAAEWHGSEDGRRWHKEHYEQMKDRLHPQIELVCQNCGKPFVSDKSTAKFCSGKCKAADRRKSGVDDVEKVCEKCGKTYLHNKYQKSRYCEDCRNQARRNGRCLQHGGSGNA